MMLDSCRRASCLHEELLVYPQCTAVPGRGGGGGLGLQARVSREESRRGCPALFLQGGEDKTGALSWQGVGPQDTSSCYGGGATATQALCFSSRREMQGQLCPARARSMPLPLILLSGLILISLYPPVQT